MVDEEHKNPPKTVQEIGIHIGYMREDLHEIKQALGDTPTRKEVDELKVEIKEKVSRKEVGVVASVLTVFMGVLSFIFSNIGR